MTIQTHARAKRFRNWDSLNPKKNPAVRRRRSVGPNEVIPTFAVKPERDAAGNPIPGKFVRFWGGRFPSKYVPHVEDQKHALTHKSLT